MGSLSVFSFAQKDDQFVSLIILPRINDLVIYGAKENSNNLWRNLNTAWVFSTHSRLMWDFDYKK